MDTIKTAGDFTGLPVIRDYDPNFAWIRVPWEWIETLPKVDKQEVMMRKKIVRIEGNASNRMIRVNGETLNPGISQKVINHSPDGFNWGYGGSGPAQTSLAILLHLTDPETAMKRYQGFKWDIISTLPAGQDFCIELDIKAWLNNGVKNYKNVKIDTGGRE